MTKFGRANGLIRTDQGGKLARSSAFQEMMLKNVGNVVELTGAPPRTMVRKYRTTPWLLRFGHFSTAQVSPQSSVSPCSSMRLTYLHNWLVHPAINKTPYEAWSGCKLDVFHPKTFKSWVCVKQTGYRCCKLEQHDYTGIILRYTATNQNIVYHDLNSGIVKACHHAIFDKAWYLQLTRPPAAQLLFNLSLEDKPTFVSMGGPLHLTQPETIKPIMVSWPPDLLEPAKPLTSLKTPCCCLYAPLPL